MKNKPAQLLLIVISFLLISPVIRAQDTEEEFTPVYVTITTIHGLVDFDFENWKAVEQEYFDNGVLMVAFVRAGVELAFETMTDAGIIDESAYYESLHETLQQCKHQHPRPKTYIPTGLR